jgi:hypothetical protein
MLKETMKKNEGESRFPKAMMSQKEIPGSTSQKREEKNREQRDKTKGTKVGKERYGSRQGKVQRQLRKDTEAGKVQLRKGTKQVRKGTEVGKERYKSRQGKVQKKGKQQSNARKGANGGRQMQKAKQESTRVVASCSTKNTCQTLHS